MTDAERKVSGLVQTLASAYVSAAACYRALDTVEGIAGTSALKRGAVMSQEMADITIGYLLPSLLERLSQSTGLDAAMDAAWPDALERPAGEVI